VTATEALEFAIARFRADPEMVRYDTSADVGGCWNTAHRFAWYLHELGVAYRFMRWRNLPGQRTPFQHNVVVDGHVICWTHKQIDPGAEWPHVEPVESYRARFGEPEPICELCGSTEKPLPCRGLVRDPWTAAIARLSRAEQARLAQLLVSGGVSR
jgi:hypothetical protein